MVTEYCPTFLHLTRKTDVTAFSSGSRLLAARFDRISHQHGDSHRPHAAGHGSNGPALGSHLVIGYVSHNPVAALGGGIFHTVDALFGNLGNMKMN